MKLEGGTPISTHSQKHLDIENALKTNEKLNGDESLDMTKEEDFTLEGGDMNDSVEKAADDGEMDS
jgi:hypothetical protein